MSDEQEMTIDAPEYDGLIADLERAKQNVREKAKTAVGALFKAFFAACPSVTAVRWSQYTPYFNDGEPCEFSTNEPDVCMKAGMNWQKILGEGGDEDEEGDGAEDESDLFQDIYYMKDGPAKATVEALCRSFDDDVFLAAFGDHARIVATPDGFHVTEYSHD